MRIYFSIDIETDGLAAGINSMISLGAAAIDMDSGEIVSKFKVNMRPLTDLVVDEDTMKWWEGFPEAYIRATENSVHASEGMRSFHNWVKLAKTDDKPVAAAWKPGFDLAFLRYYLFRFEGGDIFGRAGSGLDIKTLTAAALKQKFSETQIAAVPAELKGTEAAHSHDALDDAIEQAHVLYNSQKLLGIEI